MFLDTTHFNASISIVSFSRFVKRKYIEHLGIHTLCFANPFMQLLIAIAKGRT